MKFTIGFLVGLSIGLGVAWFSVHIALNEWSEINLSSDRFSNIDNGLAFLARDDVQMRCGLAEFVQSDYKKLKESYPLELTWILPDGLPRVTNELVKLGIDRYEESKLDEFIQGCPEFTFDCSDVKTNLGNFMCSK